MSKIFQTVFGGSQAKGKTQSENQSYNDSQSTNSSFGANQSDSENFANSINQALSSNFANSNNTSQSTNFADAINQAISNNVSSSTNDSQSTNVGGSTGVNQSRNWNNAYPALAEMFGGAAGQTGSATNAMAALLGLGGDTTAQNQAFDNFRDSTGYNFQRDEGMRAITGNNAVKGLLNSGATLKSLNKFGTGLADNSFNSYLANLMNLAGSGISAGNLISGAGTESLSSGLTNSFSNGQSTSTGMSNSIGNSMSSGSSTSGGQSTSNGTSVSGGNSMSNGMSNSGGYSTSNGFNQSDGQSTANGFASGSSLGTNSSSTKPGIAGMIGSMMSGGAASDRRLKKDIERLYTRADGLNVYSWNYIDDTGPFIGVMADEVKELIPEALGPTIGGYMTVNYDKIGAL